MPLKAVLIELRPNLSCGLVFLQFDKPMVDRKKTRLVIKQDDMHILQNCTDEDRKIVLCHNSWGMDVKHISLFNTSGCHVNFRFNYTKIDLDELYKTGCGPKESQAMPIRLNFEEGTDHVALHCNKCKGELVPGRTYNRLRELPSGLIDPSEFFCHNHGTSGQQQPLLTLVPGDTDIYYGLNHIVLNMSVLGNRINNISGVLYCKRCTWMLGSTVESGAAAKLWADTLRWQSAAPKGNGVLRTIFQYPTVTQLMLRLLDTMWPSALGQFCPQGKRAILVTTMPNRHEHYMLIHVRETQLPVLRRIFDDERSDEMCFYHASKLYYRVFGQCQHSRNWLKNFKKEQDQLNVPKMTISPYLFTELQNRFNRNASLVPDHWRYDNFDDNLMLTYFFYENDKQELQYQNMLNKQRVNEFAKAKPILNPSANRTQKQEMLEKWLNASSDDDADNESDDDEHSDSELASKLLHKSAPIMAYEKNLAKRWQQTTPTMPPPAPKQ